MGLDVSHDCWHGAYSAFTRWRNKLAEAAGYKIVPMLEDGTIWRSLDPPPGMAWPTADIDWSPFVDANFMGEWDRAPEDPLLILIVHSDCDGVIKAAHAPWLAMRLEQLLPKVADLPDDQGHIGNWETKTKTFIEGLRIAAEAGEDVEFC